MIDARGICKRFRSRAVLDGLDLRVHPKAVTLLVGSNGAGKTTLLRIIAQLAPMDAGTLEIDGIDVQRDPMAARRALAFLPQAPRFHPRLTTWQVAQYYGRLRRQPDAAVSAELEKWGLADHARVMTGHLSGGMRQRLAIAIFSLARASVLVLDEPGLSLDPFWRDRLARFLADEARQGRTVLVATHLLGEWEGRTDVCLLMQSGRVAGELEPARLREAFADAEMRRETA